MPHRLAAALVVCLACSAAAPAAAAVNVERSGSENPMVEVARSVFYGGLAGLMVGGAIDWAAEGDTNAMRWGFVGGTMLGLGMGIWHVTNRPHAMIEIEGGETRLGLAVPEPSPPGVRMTLLRASF